MIWWHQAWQPLWGHANLLDRTLGWYETVEPVAREIARRQGFPGVRWMKMTDPSGTEAPSNVGSFLIWQQPHFIYLAELVYRANPSDEVIKKYNRLVQETAEFMYAFATYDEFHGRFILKELFLHKRRCVQLLPSTRLSNCLTGTLPCRLRRNGASVPERSVIWSGMR